MGRERKYAERKSAPAPKFMSGEKTIAGNEIGTVYHKIMELADFRQTTEAGIYADVERIFGLGLFDDGYREKIMKMLGSSLGQRMAAADLRGDLYRGKAVLYDDDTRRDTWAF